MIGDSIQQISEIPLPPLSVLDQSVACVGKPHGDSIRNTLALAKRCENLGYARFWLSEHHNHPSIVGTAPEVLMAAVAATTARIRIGSAGVMLPHYAPLKVAEQFRVLEALAPGRIDLGLGRAPGSDGITAFALNPLADKRPDQFPGDVRDLMDWVNGRSLIQNHPFAQVQAFPKGDTAPEVWMLGSSDYGARVAAYFGLPYCFAWFFTEGRGAIEAFQLYRDGYKPNERHPKPHSAVCVWALAADTAEEARRQFASRAKWRLYRDRGEFLPLETPEAAAAHPYTESEKARLGGYYDTAFIGTAPEVGDKLRALAESLGIDEIAVVTWAHDDRVQWRSFELLAQEFGMVG